MGFLRQKTKNIRTVELLPIDAIEPSPHQSRRVFEERELKSLAISIDRSGLLNPISVRKTPEGTYCLIAGERRLRACKLLGWTEIPALLWEKDEVAAAALTLAENRERAELHYFEEAEGILRLLTAGHLSQSEGAALLSMSQPALCNKLRLLRLSPKVQEELRLRELPERVARALLQLPDEDLQLRAIKRVSAGGMSVRQSEQLIAELAEGEKSTRPYHGLLRDYRILFTAVDRAVEEIRKIGVRVTTQKKEESDCVSYTIRIPKSARRKEEPDRQMSLYSAL